MPNQLLSRLNVWSPKCGKANILSATTTTTWFCTAPVTLEGLPPPEHTTTTTTSSSHDSDPDPLPPPIPPHGPPTPAAPPSPSPSDPEVMTAEEAQRLLSANIVESRARETSVLSDEEAQEVFILLSPTEKNAPQHTPNPTQEPAPPPVPPHYTTPGQGDEYDNSLTPQYDPSLTSPLSPEDEPSDHDSSDASGVAGEGFQVTKVKEVMVEDGVHYLEDGHFWVEVPGIPEEDEDEEDDPSFPFHPPTRLTFSTHPVQVFSTYSVTEYDRKNDEVDPVAASAEYELEKRVEKMDVFPVEIIKGDGGLGLSIIGMGVGADAGVEKLGIFVKTITPGGATERDARIQVNDQIIEVDGKSLVGVTQVFAASVLKNTSGQVYFLIGREKDPDNSEVALLIKQSLQADREREERRRALGGPDYDPNTGHGYYDTLSSPSEDNSRSEDTPGHHHHHHHHHYPTYMDGGGVVVGSAPTSPDHTSSPPPEVFDLEGDTSDTSPDNDVGVLKLKLKEGQYRHAIAEAEITKLKMSLLEMEKVVTENTQYTAQLMEAQGKMTEMYTKLHSKETEVATYQDMLEQSQGQFIVLEKKYTKAKKIIKEYQGRERDFLHREEYHITQLEDKDSHYNALVKALKDRVIQLEHELTTAQKSAGLPVQVPTDANTQPAFWNLQQSAQNAALSKDQSLDESSMDEELPEALKQQQQQQQQQHAPPDPHHHSHHHHHHHHHQEEHSSRSIGNGREVEVEGPSPRLDRDVSPSKRSPTSLMEDVRQAVMHADVSSHHLVSPGHHQVAPPSATPTQRSQSAFYAPVSKASRESHREVPSGGSQSPKLGRAALGASVSPNPAGGVVLLSQRSLDSSSTPSHKGSTGVDASSGELSSGPASLGSGDEGSGASLGSQTSLTHPQLPQPTEHRSKRSHMWQTAPVVDWTKEQVSQWLVVQGLEGCVAKFQELAITGPRLLNLDVRDLKNLGLPTDEKNKIKRKVKELRLAVEKERKQIEKEKKGREKLQKKAEKLAEKAERKKK